MVGEGRRRRALGPLAQLKERLMSFQRHSFQVIADRVVPFALVLLVFVAGGATAVAGV